MKSHSGKQCILGDVTTVHLYTLIGISVRFTSIRKLHLKWDDQHVSFGQSLHVKKYIQKYRETKYTLCARKMEKTTRLW